MGAESLSPSPLFVFPGPLQSTGTLLYGPFAKQKHAQASLLSAQGAETGLLLTELSLAAPLPCRLAVLNTEFDKSEVQHGLYEASILEVNEDVGQPHLWLAVVAQQSLALAPSCMRKQY